MNRPKTFVNKKNVAIEGGTSPSTNISDAISREILVALIANITKKNETSKVIVKNSAAAII
jgi:hypothetical protein